MTHELIVSEAANQDIDEYIGYLAARRHCSVDLSLVPAVPGKADGL